MNSGDLSGEAAGERPLRYFDGHNDTLLRLAGDGKGARAFLEGDAGLQIDLPRARQGGFSGGLFACYVPSARMPEPVEGEDGSVETPYADPVDLASGQRGTARLAAELFRLERASAGELSVCRDVAEIRSTVARGGIAAVLHVEGAEAIDEDLDALEVYYAAGLRSLGPVWSRANSFASGVPFRFPASPDTGPGLTDLGVELVRSCNELGIMIDLSHLNEKGFWDVARISDRPLVATHSNAHALSAQTRNLTDRQLAAIAESQGLVGVNFAVKFLNPTGKADLGLPLEVVVRHVDHLIGILGVRGVAIGSDFDGATTPAALADVSRVPSLAAALRQHGYDDGTLERIFFENWLDVLERTWA